MTRGIKAGATGITLLGVTLLALTLVAGSVTTPGGSEPSGRLLEPASLVSFDSCAEALAELRAAASASVGSYGFVRGTSADAVESVLGAADSARASTSTPDKASPTYSSTNNHEVGADEPDLVKTDGRRIVTVTGGVLRVVDPADRRMTGKLDLIDAEDELRWNQHRVLLLGDRALVLADAVPEPVIARRWRQPEAVETRLLLVDLSGPPRLLGTYRIRGGTVDARLTGHTARVVVRSSTRLAFPVERIGKQRDRIQRNRALIAQAGIEAWLPEYEWTAGDERHTGRVGCDRLSRPKRMTGANTLTVLSFDLTTDRLGDGDPVGVAADADTVYGTATSLYLAGDRPMPSAGWREGAFATSQVTEIYQFDIGSPGRPRHLAAGSVPGWLINQYALSEWDGHLRVATTTGDFQGGTSQSAVRVLRRDGGALVPTGMVDGLGRGERIYSVRYLGPVGYVVTFRQTDPLYSLDLTDPTAPKVTGELKITGYSAYLHPLPAGRLLGVGQEADWNGRTKGVQVSLFDVRDPGRPTRLDQWHLPRGWSSAEHDPHAFLYRPDTGLLTLPVDDGLRLLRVTGDKLSEIGEVTHPEVRQDGGRLPWTRSAGVRRALVIGDVLWTVSAAGLRASDPTTARSLRWIAAT